MTTAIEQGTKLIGTEVSIGNRVGKIEAIRKGGIVMNLETMEETEDTVQFCLRKNDGKAWWSSSYPNQDWPANSPAAE